MADLRCVAAPVCRSGEEDDGCRPVVKGFARAYREVLEHAGPSYRKILLHIRDKPQRPFVVHCSAGKDRTGVIVALILSLLGVDDETVAVEYELTEIGLGTEKSRIIENLLARPALEQNREAALRMVGSRRVSSHQSRSFPLCSNEG